MALQYSAPVNLVRYKNSTYIKLSASITEFTSYDYDHETKTGTFEPQTITITAQFQGNVQSGTWKYSADGGNNWNNVSSGSHGMTIYGASMTLQAISDLFGDTNSYIVIMCTNDTYGYYDTITITRTIDPVIAYQKVYTDIKLDRDKIALIASDEQLQQFSTRQTMVDKMAEIKVTADGITQEVHANYATTSYVKSEAKNAYDDAVADAALDASNKAGAAENNAQSYVNNQLLSYSTTTQMNAAIDQKADGIYSSVSKTYATQTAVAKVAEDAEGYVDEKLELYSTTEQMNTAINQKVGEIELNVSKTYATQTSVAQVKNTTIVSDTIYYLATSAGSDVTIETSGWSTTPQTMTATKKYLWTYHRYKYGDNHESPTNPVITGTYGEKGDTGINGVNTATLMLYKRGDTAPAKPTATVTYTFSTHSFTGNLNGWTVNMPDGTSPCWAIAAVASSNTDSDQIPASEWSTQTKVVQDGTNGLNQATVRLYRRSSTVPSKPTTSSVYTFSTGALSNIPSGWSITIPSGALPCYTTSAAAISASETYTITAWNDVSKLVENGADGASGTDGTGILEVVTLYYASNSSTAPDAPTSEVTRTNTLAGQWTKGIPVVSSTYSYLYTCDQVKYTDNTFAWTTVVRNNAISNLSVRMNSAELKITDEAIISTVTSTTPGQNAVNSLIDQRADSIRLKADKISWESQYSRMTQTGEMSSFITNDNNDTYTAVLNQGELVYKKNGTEQLTISGNADGYGGVGIFSIGGFSIQANKHNEVGKGGGRITFEYNGQLEIDASSTHIIKRSPYGAELNYYGLSGTYKFGDYNVELVNGFIVDVYY